MNLCEYHFFCLHLIFPFLGPVQNYGINERKKIHIKWRRCFTWMHSVPTSACIKCGFDLYSRVFWPNLTAWFCCILSISKTFVFQSTGIKKYSFLRWVKFWGKRSPSQRSCFILKDVCRSYFYFRLFHGNLMV